MLLFIYCVVSEVASICLLAWWNILTYVTMKRSLGVCLGKRQEHKAVKKQEGDIFFFQSNLKSGDFGIWH